MPRHCLTLVLLSVMASLAGCTARDPLGLIPPADRVIVLAERGQSAGKLSVDELLARVRKPDGPTDERVVAPEPEPPAMRPEGPASSVAEMMQRIQQRKTTERGQLASAAAPGPQPPPIPPILLTLPAAGGPVPPGLDARLSDFVRASNEAGCAIRLVAGPAGADSSLAGAQRAIARANIISTALNSASKKLDIRYSPALGPDKLKLECKQDGDD